MTTEQKREKLIMHYKTLAQLALGAVAQLQDRKTCPTERDMATVSGGVRMRINRRLDLISEVWKQGELFNG